MSRSTISPMSAVATTKADPGGHPHPESAARPRRFFLALRPDATASPTANFPLAPVQRTAYRTAHAGGETINARTSGGAIAQLGERLNGIQEVRGSTPLGSTKQFKDLQQERTRHTGGLPVFGKYRGAISHSSNCWESQSRPACRRARDPRKATRSQASCGSIATTQPPPMVLGRKGITSAVAAPLRPCKAARTRAPHCSPTEPAFATLFRLQERRPWVDNAPGTRTVPAAVRRLSRHSRTIAKSSALLLIARGADGSMRPLGRFGVRDFSR